jgi:hypothetical protein
VLKRGLKAPSELVEKVGARERRKVKRTEKRGREAISETQRERESYVFVRMLVKKQKFMCVYVCVCESEKKDCVCGGSQVKCI